jgi:hypothetical protein
MTKEQKKAIKRICDEYDFQNLKELRQYMKDVFDDPFDLDMWSKTEEGLYNELITLFEMMK